MDDMESVLKKMGLDYQIPESGCCGMAGAFGFDRSHYDISMKCGEHVLLPAVRSLEEDALIIADGFSCHEQIVQSTGREVFHLAEVMQMALHGSDEITKEVTTMAKTTWEPNTEHGELSTKQKNDLPESVFAFPKQRKEPLTDAEHVQNALARFDQVKDVSDDDRDLAFANIKKAAKHYDVEIAEDDWHQLGKKPHTKNAAH